jgi:hypothetical protein
MRVIASDFALKEFVVFVICAAERCSSWADAKWALEHLQVAACPCPSGITNLTFKVVEGVYIQQGHKRTP